MTVPEVLRWLRARGTAHNRRGLAHVGIRAERCFGVSMETMRPLVRTIGRDHALAQALWRTGWLEARVLASLVDDPARVTPAQMERWVRGFDNWAVCDSTCIHLFAHTPHAWPKMRAWARREEEYVRRAAFALLAGLAVHDKDAADTAFVRALPLVARQAVDPRHFVKKAVNWALRQIGKRNRALNRRARAVARRLASSDSPPARWVGRDALRELTSRAVHDRLRRSARR
jgi:3-methyladenine DNA glycosylase AlkD